MPESLVDELESLEKIQGNAANIRRLVEQLKSGPGVLPFVGAGFSKPFGFPEWGEFLESQAQTSSEKTEIQALINSGKFEEAAERAAELRGDRRFEDALEDAFGEHRLRGRELKGAVSAVPAFAKGPVITTNFDRVLEAVFRQVGCQFGPDQLVWGARAGRVITALHSDAHFLLKVHGDFADKTDRVFTLSQYTRHYGSSDPAQVNLSLPLPKLLRLMLENRPLLFLGCSLKQDRTVRILKKVVEDYPELAHYAILEKPAGEEDFAVRDRFLSEHGIRPIWYPPRGHHLIEPLLQRLLRDSGCAVRRSRMPRRAGTPPWKDDEFFETGFKDRVEIRRKASDLLVGAAKRLICIYGHGGIGKTSLIGKVLKDLEHNGWQHAGTPVPVDGIVYLSQREGISFERLFSECCRIMDDARKERLDEVWRSNLTPEKKISKLLEAMAEGLYIIVMDGVEELLDRQGRIKQEHQELRLFFETALQTSAGSRLLLTSTVPLEIGDGARYSYQETLPDGLPEQDAIALLRELDADGTRGLRDASDQELRALANVTHCIPRALELVASILAKAENKLLTLEEVANKFYEQDRVVHELVEEHFRQLDPASQRVVQALAVVGRPAPLEAVIFVLGKVPNDKETTETIRQLISTHVVGYTRKPPLLSLHPIDESYAYKCIPENGGVYNRRAMHRRTADYYVTQRKQPPWKGYADIEPYLLEYDQRVLAEDFDGSVRVMDEVDYSWKNHHKFRAYMLLWGYGRRSVMMREQLRGRLSPALEVLNLAALGWVARRVNEPAKALKYLEEGLACRTEDPVARMMIRTELGFLLNDKYADHGRSVTLLREVLDQAKRGAFRYWEGMACLGLSYAEFDYGNDKEALDYANLSLAAFREVGDSLRELDSLVRLSMIHRKLKNYCAAISAVEAGVIVARKAGLTAWEGELESQLGFHLRGMGDYPNALASHQRSRELFSQEYAVQREIAVQLTYRANLLLDVGEIQDAVSEYGKALEIAGQIGIEHERSWFLGGLGIALSRLGRHEEAIARQSEAYAIVKNSSNPRSQVIRLTDLAGTFLLARRYDEACSHLLLALRVAAAIHKTGEIARLPDAFLDAHYSPDALPHEMQSPGDHQRRGTILTRLYLHTGDLSNALRTILTTRSAEHEVMPHRYYTALLHGLILYRLGHIEDARSRYLEALARADEILKLMPRYYAAQYGRWLALAGLALIAEGPARSPLFRQAREAYKQALSLCAATGVVDDAAWLLSELRAGVSFARRVKPDTPTGANA